MLINLLNVSAGNLCDSTSNPTIRHNRNCCGNFTKLILIAAIRNSFRIELWIKYIVDRCFSVVGIGIGNRKPHFNSFLIIADAILTINSGARRWQLLFVDLRPTHFPEGVTEQRVSIWKLHRNHISLIVHRRSSHSHWNPTTYYLFTVVFVRLSFKFSMQTIAWHTRGLAWKGTRRERKERTKRKKKNHFNLWVCVAFGLAR